MKFNSNWFWRHFAISSLHKILNWTQMFNFGLTTFWISQLTFWTHKIWNCPLQTSSMDSNLCGACQRSLRLSTTCSWKAQATRSLRLVDRNFAHVLIILYFTTFSKFSRNTYILYTQNSNLNNFPTFLHWLCWIFQILIKFQKLFSTINLEFPTISKFCELLEMAHTKKLIISSALNLLFDGKRSFNIVKNALRLN